MDEVAIEDEVRQLRADSALRNVAARMARDVDPEWVDRLEIGGDPTRWYRDFMHQYWRLRSQSRFALVHRDAPARAVLAVYAEKRGQLDRCPRL